MDRYSFEPIQVGDISEPLEVDIGRSLVGATAMTMKMVERGTGFVKVSAGVAVMSPTSETVERYWPVAADVNRAGVFDCTFRATLADGKPFVSPPIELEIRANP